MHLHSESPLLLLLLQNLATVTTVWMYGNPVSLMGWCQPTNPQRLVSWVDPGFRVRQPEVVLVGPLMPAFWIPPSRWTWHTTASVPVAASCYQRFWGTKKFLQFFCLERPGFEPSQIGKKHIPCLFLKSAPLKKQVIISHLHQRSIHFWDAWCQADYVAWAKVSKDYTQLEGWRLEMPRCLQMYGWKWMDQRLEFPWVGISMGCAPNIQTML